MTHLPLVPSRPITSDILAENRVGLISIARLAMACLLRCPISTKDLHLARMLRCCAKPSELQTLTGDTEGRGGDSRMALVRRDMVYASEWKLTYFSDDRGMRRLAAIVRFSGW